MLEVSVSKRGADPEWDSFLETRPDGCYQQSSLWAELKAAFGWKPVRLVVREDGEIVGGVQMLLRSLPVFGMVGYVSKGPVIARDDPKVQGFVLDQMDRVAREEHILFLKAQPPYRADDVAQRLIERGALPGDIGVVSQATARVDIRPDPDDILARMRNNRRKAIRRAERKGVTVRRGTADDWPAFLRLLSVHSDYRGYGTAPASYYSEVWSVFSREGRSCLLLAEYEHEILAAMLTIYFGDVVVGLWIVDSGRHPKLGAQSLLRWKTMLWGKEKGCSWYDFGGVCMSTARAVMKGEDIPTTTRLERVAWTKMSFGSQAIIRPGACDISYVWPRRLTGRMVPKLMKMQPLLRSLLGGSLYGEFE
jgi:lipid II:glycine glycyltransferase (peptidoglycan interpeptide bridge formation enzyme)